MKRCAILVLVWTSWPIVGIQVDALELYDVGASQQSSEPDSPCVQCVAC